MNAETETIKTDDMLVISIIVVVLASKIYSEFLNFILQLKRDILNYLWLIILAVVFMLFLAMIGIYYKIKWDKEKKKRKEIDDAIYYKKVKAQEALEKQLHVHVPQKRNNEEHIVAPVETEIPLTHYKKEINVDFNKIFYRREELNDDEAEYLLKSGYQKFEAKSIASGKREEFILRPRHNEHLVHLFFTYDIAEYIRKRNVVANTYTTQMPDIVFISHGKTYAVEVETGSVMKNMKKFREKVENLNQKYKDRWFFVPTNKNLVQKYRKYGKTVDPRCISNFLERLLKNRKICPAKKAGGRLVHRR